MGNQDVFSQEYLDAWNSYFYPGTDILINKLDIRDQETLDKRDAELSFERLVELYENPIEGSFNAEHLRNIHHYIFQDLYDWAGEYRHVHMGKNNSAFCNWQEIGNRLDYELELLNNEIKHVTNMDTFKNLVADYLITLLNIHPFRDGNGRSTREFLREIVVKKTQDLGFGDYELDWSKISDDDMNQYMPMARFLKSPIEMLISKAIVPKEKIRNI